MPDEPAKPSQRGSWVLRAMEIACYVLAGATVLGPIVGPQFARSTRYSGPVCGMFLDQLESAKALLATERRLAPGTIIRESALTDYLKDQRLPKCPQGGKYTINPIGVPVNCSIHGPTEGQLSLGPDTNLVPPDLLALPGTNR